MAEKIYSEGIMKNLLTFIFFFILINAANAQTPTGPTQTIFPRTGPGYDYVPSITYVNGIYRMYWCGSRANYPRDNIFYAESNTPTGPFHAKGSATPNTFSVVLTGSGDPKSFDYNFVCDPSIIQFEGKWYLYYGGISDAAGYHRTEIGVASSKDGFKFTRLNGGRSILKSHKEATSLNGYGTGQPSALVKDGYIYLSHTDTYARGTQAGSAAGQFVVRSKDPTFQTGVESRNNDHWIKLEDLTSGREEPYERYFLRTIWSFVQIFSTDWAYQKDMNQFVVANHGQSQKLELITYDADTFQKKTDGLINYTLPWTDGPALTRTFDGGAIVNSCTIDSYGSFGGTDVFSSKLGIQGSKWDSLCQ